MQLVKLGTGLGIGMMGLGALGAFVWKIPERDPVTHVLPSKEASGSLIVFGFAAIVIASVAGACLEKKATS